MKASIIVNPRAGQRRGIDIATKAKSLLEASGWTTQTHVTEPSQPEQEKSATVIAKQVCVDADRIVVAGGDGTLREVISGLGEKAKHMTVVFLPLGNANIIAQEFDIPRDADLNVALVTSDNSVVMDVGKVNEQIFLAVVGVGYDALVTRIVDGIRSTKLGSKVYNWGKGADILYGVGGLFAAMRFFPQQFKLATDGESANRTYPTIWITNTHYYAKGWCVTPNANATDGKLDYHACKRSGLIRPLIVLYKAKQGQSAPTWISEYGVAKNVHIESSKPFRWQVDGDPMAATRTLDIEILPGYFNIVIKK